MRRSKATLPVSLSVYESGVEFWVDMGIIPFVVAQMSVSCIIEQRCGFNKIHKVNIFPFCHCIDALSESKRLCFCAECK